MPVQIAGVSIGGDRWNLELGPETLERPRPPERRLVGNCRASTVLACGLLREAGVPARARCGFSAYFTSPILGNHWVVEYWSAERPGWRLMDAELIEESGNRPAPELDDARRRYYRLTPLGRRVLAAESDRLEDLVRLIRAKRGLRERKAES